ncbi:MAG: hypothetical protein HP011_09785 [Akkermansia sp.]|uniref:hypothetical protein n=1 Tax=uncultured Akkermansia sp. TaxID=512294 RepID=UPI002591CB89|nr:hypothetical protein [uncultured Akkermansia sp.]MBS1432738.1 hypothetical protein [Akkermansia sp.]
MWTRLNNGPGSLSRKEEAMIFDIAQLIVVLVSIFSFGYYRYLAGQYKGFLKAIEVYLKYEEKENEDDA